MEASQIIIHYVKVNRSFKYTIIREHLFITLISNSDCPFVSHVLDIT
jgi:hypothetical protein